MLFYIADLKPIIKKKDNFILTILFEILTIYLNF
jgi:hypothetical protein